jgi:hypothetical protein
MGVHGSFKDLMCVEFAKTDTDFLKGAYSRKTDKATKTSLEVSDFPTG